MVNVYLYSSVRYFVIADTDENSENWYMTNNNQFTVYQSSGQAKYGKLQARVNLLLNYCVMKLRLSIFAFMD